MSKKTNNKISVEFVAKSQQQVTGSSILVTVPTKDKPKKLLIELGSNQTNRDLYTEYILNKEIVKSVPAKDLDYAFVLHTHLDHIGNLPSLMTNGFEGIVISNHENAKLMQPMLLDAAYIMWKNVNAINSKKKKIEPLFTDDDVYKLMNKVYEYNMNKLHKLDDDISFKFISAGHILGSCQLILYIKTINGQIKKIHVTSDLGSNIYHKAFVKDREQVDSSNITICEATYNDINRGYKNKLEVQKERTLLKNKLIQNLKNKRSTLIGVFAQARQQAMMEFLYRTFKDDKDFNYPIYIDGVLGLNLNNIYLNVLEGEEKEYWREIMNWKHFHYVNDFESSQKVALNRDETKIVLASSGMFNNGRILNHLKIMVEDRRSMVVLCGYQGEGTVGHELQRKRAKTLKIEGLEYKKSCEILQLNTWSSHIMPMENINFMSKISTPLIILHHSDDKNKHVFRDIVEKELRKRNNTAKIVCATNENNIFYI